MHCSQEAGARFQSHDFTMRKAKLREVWELAEGPTVGKWQTQDLNSALSA